MEILEKHLGEELELSTLFNEYFRQINKVKEFYVKKYESKFNDYRKMNTKELDKYVNKKLASLSISKKLNKIDKSNLLVSSDYNSLYPSAMAHDDSTWPSIETAKGIRPEDSKYLCELFNNNEWKDLNRTGFFKVKYHNPEHLVLQHIAVNEEVFNEIKNKYERINRFRNDDITQYLTSVDIEQVVRTGAVIIEFYEGFICDKLDYNPFKDHILDMTANRNEYKEQGKNILQTMCKNVSNGTYGGCIRRDIIEKFKCLTENWMKTEYDDRVKNWFPLENGNFMVNIQGHEGIDDNGVFKKNKFSTNSIWVDDIVTFEKINERCNINIRWIQKQ